MILFNNIQKEIVIFGTGLDAVKCAYELYSQEISIKYFLNNKKLIDLFLGVPVYEPTPEYVSDSIFVIIAVRTISTYVSLSEQLDKLGLEEFTNYINYKWIKKKMVLLHGNCHMTVIQDYLESSKKFLSEYAIYPNPLIYENKSGKIADIVIKNCDIWIHEDIREDNAFGYFLSDTYIRKKWTSTGGKKREIIIPNLFGFGKAFFPQTTWNSKNEAISNMHDANGMFPHGDTIIDKCAKKGMLVDEIISFCESNLVLDERMIIDNFENCMMRIREREKVWDVKIYDFIMNNYKKVKLFYDDGHPTNIILEKISIDILQKLGIIENIYSNIMLDAHENPIYPMVKRCLELEWDETEIRKSSGAKKMCYSMDFEEYIREYLWWCYKM